MNYTRIYYAIPISSRWLFDAGFMYEYENDNVIASR